MSKTDALLEAVDRVDSIAEFVQDHLDGFHTGPGDDCRERLHEEVAALVVAARVCRAAAPAEAREEGPTDGN